MDDMFDRPVKRSFNGPILCRLSKITTTGTDFGLKMKILTIYKMLQKNFYTYSELRNEWKNRFTSAAAFDPEDAVSPPSKIATASSNNLPLLKVNAQVSHSHAKMIKKLLTSKPDTLPTSSPSTSCQYQPNCTR